MKNVSKQFLIAGILCSITALCSPNSAEARGFGNDQDILNQLVQEGAISPDQSSAIGSRAMGGGYNRGYAGGWGGGFIGCNPNFGFVPGSPTHYDSNLIQRIARQLDRLHGDRVISDAEVNALKSQFDSRVHMVNENPGITQNGGFRGNHAYGNPNGFNGNPGGIIPRFNRFGNQNNWH